MRKWFRFLVGTTLALTLSGTVLAQDDVTPKHTEPMWSASYWNNTTLTGTPVLQRSEAAIDYNWGSGSPDPAVHSDGFSARWTRYVDVSPGIYRFTATFDDGMRVWVDGDKIVDQWADHATVTVFADKTLGAGHHLVMVEYYENQGAAVATFSWTPAPVTIIGWKGEYFNNTTLSGTPVTVRDDPEINFDWGNSAPVPGLVNADAFSVRWTRTVRLTPGWYAFSMTIDDGSRLWVNGHLLIDSWQVQAVRTYSGQIYLPGGPTDLKVEYYENTGLAAAKLSWTSPDAVVPPNLVPPRTVIVDNRDSGFIKGGLAIGWHSAVEDYGGDLLWTRNNDWLRPGYNWVHWVPKLAAGRYEVFVYIPDRYTTTTSARYGVSHYGGYSRVDVNQSTHGTQWVSLGTYRFHGTSADYVSLDDATGEPLLTHLITFDAVKWVPK